MSNSIQARVESAIEDIGSEETENSPPSPYAPFGFPSMGTDPEESESYLDVSSHYQRHNHQDIEIAEVQVVAGEEEVDDNNSLLLLETNSDSGSSNSSTRTSPDKELPAFELKSKSLTMKVSEPPLFPASSVPNKRPLCFSNEGDGSQSKKMKSNEDDVQNAGLDSEDDNRIDIDGDEIGILKGFIGYHAENGLYPFDDSGALNDFMVKNSLDNEGDLLKLERKIQELRGKFMKNVKEQSVSGLDNQEAFELSKKIWGDGNCNDLSKLNKEEKNDSKNGHDDHEDSGN